MITRTAPVILDIPSVGIIGKPSAQCSLQLCFCSSFFLKSLEVTRKLRTFADDMSSKECISKLSRVLLWDIDIEQADMDKHPAHYIQRVLEYGNLEDWILLRSYYGLPKIVAECKQLRTLDPVCLSFICAISDTKPEEYRCYHFRQSFPTHWNS